jgi:hypothetical protein
MECYSNYFGLPAPTHIDFDPTAVKNTNIHFTEVELSLLNKCPKYNLHHKPIKWIRNLAWKAETLANLLPEQQQE